MHQLLIAKSAGYRSISSLLPPCQLLYTRRTPSSPPFLSVFPSGRCLSSVHSFASSSSMMMMKKKKLQGERKHSFRLVFASLSGSDDPEEIAKREQVSKLLGSAARNFRRYGTLGFWGQLVCTVVSAAILAFSVAISGTPTSQATFYATAGGITAAFLSVFWSFGYIRLSERLRDTVNNLKKAPPRAEVVKNLQNGIIINLLGMGLTLLGLQATIGALVAKSLTASAGPYLQGTAAGYSPVLALDVFLVQASSNTVLSHFLGLVFSMELLRSITLSQPPPESVIPKLT